MNQNLLIVSFSFRDEKIGEFTNPEESFALPCENSGQCVESLRWAIAINQNGPMLSSYQKTLSELDDLDQQLILLIEGRIEYFEINDSRYYVKSLPFEPGQHNPKDLNGLRPGDMLYIREDKEGNDIGIFADFDERYTSRFIYFFKTSDPQTLTLYNYMPFVIEGEAGYMINLKRERTGSLLKYAKPLPGFFFFVVDCDSNRFIVDVNGRKVTGSSTKIEILNPGYNGYIVFADGDKYGFIHAESATQSPVVFDEIDTVEMGEPVRVRKDGEWGYLTETFDFISEAAIQEDDSLTDDIYWYGDE